MAANAMHSETFTPLDLTFGVELELLHLQNYPPNQRPRIGDDRKQAQRQIHDALSQPLTANCASCDEPQQFSLAERLNPLPEMYFMPFYNKWTVDEDKSVSYTPEETSKLPKTYGGYLAKTCVEIQSRILGNSQTVVTSKDHFGRTHVISPLEEIKAVCDQLRDDFHPRSFAYETSRLVVNPKCGFHVHVGNGTKGFPVRTLKNILKLTLAFERLIDYLHSSNRIAGNTLTMMTTANPGDVNWEEAWFHSDVFNRPWSSHFFRNAFEKLHTQDPIPPRRYDSDEFPERRFGDSPKLKNACGKFDIPSWLTIVDHVERVKDAQDLQQPWGHRSTLNLDNLTGEKAKKTIEFRMHAGTLEADEINAWVDVVTRLVLFAHEHTEADIHSLCLDHWADPNFDTLDFLKVIGCGKEVLAHYANVLGTAESDESDYVNRVRDSQLAVVRGDDENKILLPLFEHMIKTKAQAMQPGKVRAVIDAKFLKGCYGQFPAEYLEGLGISAEEKKRLTLRLTVAPVCSQVNPRERGFANVVAADKHDGEVQHKTIESR